MAFYEITFSPTGGTKKVSGLFTEAYGAESTYIDLTDRTVDFAAYCRIGAVLRREGSCRCCIAAWAVEGKRGKGGADCSVRQPGL